MRQYYHWRAWRGLFIGFMVLACNLVHGAVGRLGRTHFINGLSARLHRTWAQQPHIAKKIAPRDAKGKERPSSIACLFSDRDDLRAQFIDCIQRESDAIDIAAFALTDKPIAEALREADARGVAIRLLVDKNLIRDHGQKLDWVKNGAQAQLTVYNPPPKGWYTPTMHNKYALFYNQGGGPLVWTGSYNLSRKASDHNEENAVKLHDADVFDDYKENFEALLSKCASFGSTKAPKK